MESAAQSKRIYRFGLFQLDPQAGKLLRDGLPVRLQEQPLKLLSLLLDRPGEIVGRDQLRRSLWSDGRYVEFDGSINTALKRLRDALGDDADNPTYIETVPKRGYRFIAPVDSRSEPDAAHLARSLTKLDQDRAPPSVAPPVDSQVRPPRLRWPLVLGAVTALAVLGIGIILARALLVRDHPARRSEAGALRVSATSPSPPVARRASASIPTPSASVAVMPFVNLTGDPSKEYFCDGLAEELIDALVRVPGLKVPARTSSFAYKGRNVDVRRIARDLGVTTVLEGSVRSAGERIRVTAELVNAQTGFHFWSQSYDRRFGDVFKLQDDLAAQIVRALEQKMNVVLGPGAAPTLTSDPEAYRLYLQASAVYPLAPQRPNALNLVQRAIQRDPRFARAIALSARIRLTSVLGGWPLPNALPDAEREAKHALELDPTLAPAYADLGSLEAARGNWLAAEARYREALRFGADDALTHATYATYVLESVGHLREAVAETENAYRLAPASPSIVFLQSGAYSVAGRDAKALEKADLAASLGFNASNTVINLVYAAAMERSGQYEEAAARIIPTLPPAFRSNDAATILQKVFRAFGTPAQRPAAARTLSTLLRQVAPSDLDFVTSKDVLEWYTQLGDLDDAYKFAGRTVDGLAPSGTVGTAWGVLWIPEMRPFRRDSRFQAFVTRLKLPDYWRQYGPPDQCDFEREKLTCE